MPGNIIKQQYIALAKLLKHYRTSPFDRTLLKETHLYCRDLFDTAKSHPDIVFSQPQLYKSQLPFSLNLTFNGCVLTCLFGIRNKVDDSVVIQLMCGSISLYALEQTSLETHYVKSESSKIGSIHKELTDKLKKSQQHIWLQAYLTAPYLHKQLKAPVHQAIQSPAILVYLANKLAVLCTPNKRYKTYNFYGAFKQVSLACPASLYSYLTPMMYYPGMCPPGSYAKHKDGSFHVILGLTQSGWLTRTIPVNSQGANRQEDSSPKLLKKEQLTQYFPSQNLNNFMKMNTWWDSEAEEIWNNHPSQKKLTPWEKSLPIQSAPPSLLVIQDQLKQIDINIEVVIKAIENEPAYVQQLQTSATNSNRQNQQVQRIQHSLAMLGFERASGLLLQQSLISRLNQQSFPLQRSFLMFSQLFVFIANELANKTKVVTPEVASSTAYFVVSRLFTHPKLRIMTNWKTLPGHTFTLSSLITLKEKDALKKDAILLAKSWQQNANILKVLSAYDSPGAVKNKATLQFSYLIGLSLLIARETYLEKQTRDGETEKYIDLAHKNLGVTSNILDDVLSNTISNTHIYCPID